MPRVDAKQLRGTAMLDAFISTPLAVTFASSLTLDVSLNSDFAIGALTANLTIAFANAAAGRQGTIGVRQDGTGSRIITFTAPSGFTLVRDLLVTDLQPQITASTLTLYSYLMFAIAGNSFLALSKTMLG
jgi:hypothetical protein